MLCGRWIDRSRDQDSNNQAVDGDDTGHNHRNQRLPLVSVSAVPAPKGTIAILPS